MKKRELEIALRAAARVARETEFFVIGTQAVYVYVTKHRVAAAVKKETARMEREMERGVKRET